MKIEAIIIDGKKYVQSKRKGCYGCDLFRECYRERNSLKPPVLLMCDMFTPRGYALKLSYN